MTIHYRDGRKEERTIRVLSREREQGVLEFDRIADLFNDVRTVSLGDNVGVIGRIYSEKEKRFLKIILL